MNDLPTSTVVSSQPERVSFEYRLKSSAANVQAGQRVRAGEVIGVRSAETPVAVVDLAAELGRGAVRAAARAGKFVEGSFVSEGQPLVEAGGPFGLGKRALHAPVSGSVIAFVDDPGLLIIRPQAREEQVTVHFPCTITRVSGDGITVELTGWLVHGMVGFGIPVSGALGVVHGDASISDSIRRIIDTGDVTPPRIIAFQRPVDLRVVQLLREAYWRPDQIAVLGPCVAAQDVSPIRESFSGMSVVAVDGYGSHSFGNEDNDPVWRTIVGSQGKEVVIIPTAPNGGSLLVLPWTRESDNPEERPALEPGAEARFQQGMGMVRGRVVEVPNGCALLPSGHVTEVALVAMADGTESAVARANLEILAVASEGMGVA